MNNLYDEEIRGHHSMRDHVLTLLSDSDLDYKLPGANPSLADLLIELGTLQGIYTHSFRTFELDWAHQELPTPEPVTISTLRSWFDTQDDAMKTAMDRFTPDELQIDRIDRGGGFIASPFIQHEIYREAVYIFYGKMSVYLKALERDAGDSWTAWVG